MNIEAIRARASEMMAKTPEVPCEPGYRLNHGRRTEILSLEIADAEKLSVDRDPLAMGALLHDIGKDSCVKGESHAECGAHILRDKFADLMSPDEIFNVAEIIAHHYERPNSKWYEGKEKPVWNLEILLVQDADVLDHFGTPGIWLSMHWAVYKNFGPAESVEQWFSSDFMCAWRQEARRSLNFRTSRRLLELRIAEMDAFFRRLK